MSGKEMINKEHQEVIGPADLYERDKVPSFFQPLALFFSSTSRWSGVSVCWT